VKRPVLRARTLRASGDRWLFGYADIVTLLFACFAALYATRLAPVAAAPAPPAQAPIVPVQPQTPSVVDHRAFDLEAQLAQVVGREGTLGGIEISDTTRGLVISLPEAGSFSPGRAELSADGRRVIAELAATLNGLPNQVRVEGHTDDTPIHGGAFASNWELSTARATDVVQFLIEACGFDPARLSAAGYAEYRPRVANDSIDGRARNRRVDIVVLDSEAAAIEPPRR